MAQSLSGMRTLVLDISATRYIFTFKMYDWIVHFYGGHRYEFSTGVTEVTGKTCHVMSLVEGESVLLETGNGRRQHCLLRKTCC